MRCREILQYSDYRLLMYISSKSVRCTRSDSPSTGNLAPRTHQICLIAHWIFANPAIYPGFQKLMTLTVSNLGIPLLRVRLGCKEMSGSVSDGTAKTQMITSMPWSTAY